MSAPLTASDRSSGALFVDHELEAAFGSLLRAAQGATPLSRAQVSPASVDLRLGKHAWRIRAGFLPGLAPIEARVEELAVSKLDLEGDGAVFERGLAYLVPLEEELALSSDVRARFNPRSSTGRCDIFTRILCDGHARFDEAPSGYHGRLWIEIAPLSFPVRLRRGDRLAQIRLSRGDAALSATEVRVLHSQTPLLYDGARPLAPHEVSVDADGGLALSVGLVGREPSGWRAASHTELIEFSRESVHDPLDFWEPVRAHEGRSILAPGSFYIFASKERLRVPPELAAEMLPIDVGIGELRNNYAGFFDNGFGWSDAKSARPGTPAVLEVRAHDVPFLVEDGQPFCRLRFFRTSGRPTRLYGEGKSASYRDQDLTLARCFKQSPSAR